MKIDHVVITNKLGLHARAAAKLVQLSNQFSADIVLEKDGQTADAKSIMDVLMLTGTKDSRLKVSAEGKDEAAAIIEVVGLIQDKFGEGE
ncbi:MAG: HPr family phosphocarrier protein [SAR324 cluster bacterium]|nr:HPr family phosphocarrier protein [SAR324 cluster bacterium]